MATFENNIKSIRNSSYGGEVREAIAEGIIQAKNNTNSNLSFNIQLNDQILGGGSYDGLNEKINISTKINGSTRLLNYWKEDYVTNINSRQYDFSRLREQASGRKIIVCEIFTSMYDYPYQAGYSKAVVSFNSNNGLGAPRIVSNAPDNLVNYSVIDSNTLGVTLPGGAVSYFYFHANVYNI